MNAKLDPTSPVDVFSGPQPSALSLQPFLAPVFAQYPIEVVAADGVWLVTRDGRRVLDLYGGHAV
ncbi:MAG: hypothetical protein ACRETX_13230, partial [Steroidobacteraceae bacterium]